MSETIGPNVRRLIAHRMAQLMIPAGTTNPLAAGAHALSSGERVRQYAKEASRWVQEALAAINAAPGNPYGTDDEVVAARLLQGIAERQRAAGIHVKLRDTVQP